MSSRKFGGRTLARSQALQLLFQAEATGRTVPQVLAGPYALSQDDPLDEFGERLALGADDLRHDLDAVIAQYSTNWSLKRMPSVDRNLLRLALFEMFYVDEVAVPVTIDESVELAKAFGTDESSRFINGLLGRVASYMEAGVDVVGEACAYAAEKAAELEDEVEAEGDEPDAQAFVDEDADGAGAGDEGDDGFADDFADEGDVYVDDAFDADEAASEEE
ncbi:MAG: transcription antitermination factor NusB [Coriobacteriales bacterium]|nr:transcription antitermination factor NusB [Coriobacteriales bacterium]